MATLLLRRSPSLKGMRDQFLVHCIPARIKEEYHGGTNFGRTTGGPFIATSYDYDAPIDEYGFLRQPKWGHLKDVHKAIKLCEQAMVATDPTISSLGSNLEASVYKTGSGLCVAFLANIGTQSEATVNFNGNSYQLPPWSVSILHDCKNVVHNTAKEIELNERDTVMWFIVRSGKGNSNNAKVSIDVPITLIPRKNKIDLLSLTVGLQNYGAFFDEEGAGITGPVKLTGLKGEELGLSNGGSSAWVSGATLPKEQPLIWYKTTFDTPSGTIPVALDFTGMGKGEAFVNGQSIGRYWPTYIAPSSGCTDSCNYKGSYSSNNASRIVGNPLSNCIENKSSHPMVAALIDYAQTLSIEVKPEEWKNLKIFNEANWLNSGNEISVGETKRKRENVLQLDEQTNQKNKRPREFSMLSENIAQGMCLVDSDIEINVGERRQKRESELQLDEESNEANKRPRGLYRQRKEQNTSQLSALSGNIAQGIVQKDSRNGSSQTFEREHPKSISGTQQSSCRPPLPSTSGKPRVDVFAALVAVVNTKFPQVGHLLWKRIILQLKRAYKRNDKPQLLATVKFIGHLVNQQVVHELLALELLTLLLDKPTDDSVERFRGILHEGEIGERVQFLIEGLFAIRKANFQGYPVVRKELDLVEQDDQLTHEISLQEEELDSENALDVFKPDAEAVENEERYEQLKKTFLGDKSEDVADSVAGSGDEDDEESDIEEDEEQMKIKDETVTNLSRENVSAVLWPSGAAVMHEQDPPGKFQEMLYALPWHILAYIRLTEEDTTSSSRIFIKILFQELSEHLEICQLNEHLSDPTIQDYFESIFPKDSLRNSRFSINFFTAVGLGGITESLREYVKSNAPCLIVQLFVDTVANLIC
ncbi:hypothetical protein RHGRI_002002 [Rhododendron griersonianum]|uniref:beta-galactosidase n=1 Tax=Rhododendron griersonianum TaxID=479676 RepID=A0AAV6LR47_9ERIC|nr:hypothetical protein RHGRI_002002 [Rhododendron griersonianum]